MRVPLQEFNVSYFVWLAIFGFLFLVSCEWFNTQDNDIDSIIALEYNPFLPLDTSDIWIYKNTSTIYEYGSDSLIGNFTTYDTLRPERVIRGVSQYECRKFDNKIFHTQSDKIVLLAHDQSSVKLNHPIPILFTDQETKSWSYVIADVSGEAKHIEFSQRLNKNHLGETIKDKLVLSIQGSKYIGFPEYYLFKKDTGIIKSIGHINNTDYTLELIKFYNQ